MSGRVCAAACILVAPSLFRGFGDTRRPKRASRVI